MSYDEAFASVYDAFTKNIDYCAEAEFIMTVMQNAGVTGNTILDVACGTGTLAEMLLERGNEVICVDISQEMLGKARDKLCRYGDRVLLLCQDMCELDLFGTVDCAVCMLDSINHLKEYFCFWNPAECLFSMLTQFINTVRFSETTPSFMKVPTHFSFGKTTFAPTAKRSICTLIFSAAAKTAHTRVKVMI